MTKSCNPSASAAAEPESQALERPSDNAAIHRCLRAWQRAYAKKFNECEDEYDAEKEGLKAFSRAMPPLAGYENVRDFIACVTYASLNDLMRHDDAEHYLEAAKVALGALRHEPKRTENPVA